MVGFAAALAKATLVPQPGSVDLVHTNLHPGRSLRAYIDQPAFRDTVKQIGGNVCTCRRRSARRPVHGVPTRA
ncbi:hypothetical protein SANTM175S_00781 [Streptomyces antimycoticus]